MNWQRCISFLPILLVPVLVGCGLQEIRSKSKLGPEYRHSGTNGTDLVRWTVQQGVEFKWDKGIDTGITYRRRDVDDGGGSNDNGVWFDVSFPIWRAKKDRPAAVGKIAELERRVAELEARLRDEDHAEG